MVGMPGGNKASYQLSPAQSGVGVWTLLSTLAAISIITLFTVAFESEAQKRALEQQRAAVIDRLGSVRSTLEGALWRDTALTRGLVAEIENHPDLDQRQYAAFVQSLITGRNSIKYIAAARDLIISHVYPMTEYDRIIGLDYRSLPSQFPAIRDAMDNVLPLMIGPIDLVQGGTGVILRSPVFIRSEDSLEQTPWGIVSAVIDYEKLLFEAGIADPGSPIDIIVLGSDGVSESATPLYGDIAMMNMDPVSMPLGFPGDQWRIAAIPKGGWGQHARIGHTPRLLAMLSVMAVLAGCFVKVRSDRAAAKLNLAITRSESRFRTLFENASDGILLIDPSSGTIRNANQRAASVLERGLPALKGLYLSDLIAKRRSEGTAETLLSLKDGETAVLRMSFIRSGDQPLDSEVSVSRMTDEGAPLLLAHMRDMSPRREHETALRRARMDAENANALKSRFLANFSHEIRTPLNAIVGFSEIMKEGLFGPVTPQRYESYVSDIHKSGQHLLAMINDILDLSRIEAGEMPIDRDFENLAGIVDDSIAITAPLATLGQVIVRRDEEIGAFEVECDITRLRQMLINLLSNAVKFTLPGGSVMIGIDQDTAGGVTLAITDTGIGMSEKDIEDAMRPFGQVASHRTDRHVGSGLGLTLTRALSDLQQIGFNLDSTPGVGTTVRLMFAPERTRPAHQADMFRARAT